MRAAVRRSASARPGWRSTATTRPSSRISAARCVVLPPGAAHRSSTRSPGCGSSARGDRHRGARLRHEQALLPQRRAEGVERRRRARGPRAAGRRRARARAGARAAARRRSAACWRAGPPRRARCRRPSARAPRPARARRTTARRSSAGASGAAPPRRACRRAAPRRAPRASRAARRRTALTSPAPRGDESLGELDRLADRRVRGHAVEEGELEHAEPQRGEHRGLESLDRPRRPASRSRGRASRGAGRRRRRARVASARSRGSRPWRPRLAVQRAVRVGALLEDPPHDGVRARASG